MLENKTANNIVDRYHRIITGDQNQIEVGTASTCIITVTNTAGVPVGVFVPGISAWGTAASSDTVNTTGKEITAFVTADGGIFQVEGETYAVTAVTGNATIDKGAVIYTGDCGITIGLA